MNNTLLALVLLLGGVLIACQEAPEDAPEHELARILREDWKTVFSESKVGDHEECEHTDARMQKVCCDGLLRDLEGHSRAQDVALGEGEFFTAVVETARLFDALDSYCDSCGGQPEASSLCGGG